MLSTQVKKYLLISIITVVAIASAIIVGVSSGNKHDDSTSSSTKLCLVSGNIVSEEDDKGIEDVVVVLCDTTNKEIDTSETNNDGKYEFKNVEVGQYSLKLVLPDTKYNGLGKQITFLIDGSKTNYTISTIKLSKSNGNWGPLT